eukprot:TRINITY_DN10312_c0_g1_i1.p1 TRINITY_DN10312_c0_g1~~TRINITY_DN10312_c0_g1_i1.p1  ORF type:complete len:123 (-),score=39.21 TRINITY_DN10312_c0_g1_i1:123-443(-)
MANPQKEAGPIEYNPSNYINPGYRLKLDSKLSRAENLRKKRLPNAIVGITLAAFAIGVYYYSFRALTQTSTISNLDSRGNPIDHSAAPVASPKVVSTVVDAKGNVI